MSDDRPDILVDNYVRKALVVDVYDGDSITLNVDLGFDTWHKSRFRLLGVNTPEIRGEERPKGLLAKEWVQRALPVGAACMVRSVKSRKGKYGRYLAAIQLRSAGFLAELLIAHGYAKPYDGKGPMPRFPEHEEFPL